MTVSDIRIYKTKDRPLPKSLTGSEEFAQLNEAQRFNFRARLRYIEEITLKIEEWVSGAETDFFVFLDSVELDLYINQGAPIASGTEHISAWLVHSSWTFETSAVQMGQSLAATIQEQIEQPQPRLDSPISDFRSWIAGQNRGLVEALSAFYQSESFDAAMGSQLAIDALVLNLLAGVTRARLNRRLASLKN